MVATARNDRAGRQVADSEGQLLDVLYEILAQGGEGHGSASTEDVERFLHEHARAPKSLDQMRAFFQQHGLSTDPASYTSDPELAEVASGLHRERSPASVIMPLDADDDEPEPVTEPGRRVAQQMTTTASPSADASPFGDFSGIMPSAARPKQKSPPRRRAALVGIALVAIGLLGVYVRAEHLEDELTRARLRQQTTDAALSQLEKRAGSLSESLSSSEAQRTQLNQQFDAYVAAQNEERAREQLVLERLLGTRYRKLSEQAKATPTP
jgi:hypothetical protein